MHVPKSGRRLKRSGRNRFIITAVAGATALIAGQAASAAHGSAGQRQARTPTLYGPMTPALAAELSQNVNQPVIVIMKGQLAQDRVAPPPRRPARARSAPPDAVHDRAGAGPRDPHQALHPGQRRRGDGLGGRGAAAGGEPGGRRGHPGRDDPGAASALRRPRPPRRPASPPTLRSHDVADAEQLPGACAPTARCSSPPRAWR